MDKIDYDNQELGRLFEKACIPILKELFTCWGYEGIEYHPQKSGSQHGGDILFKLSKNNFPLYIFVECKASKSYNEIDVYDLKKKIDQFDWAGYAHKDIHLFLSPTRGIKFDNEVKTIEDDSLPFIVIDWMRKEDARHPFVDLFFAYEGECPVVFEYREVLKDIGGEVTPAKRFSEIAVELGEAFQRRIGVHYGHTSRQRCRFINGAFWQLVKETTDNLHMSDYYTKTDAKHSRLQEVVANDFYVRNKEMETAFEKSLEPAIDEGTALIEILSRGGEGKSTFLYHIARTYYHDYNIFYLYRISEEILNEIYGVLQRLNNQKAVMFILDNAAAHGDDLVNAADLLDVEFNRFNLVFVTAERDIRYKDIENIGRFKNIFNQVYPLDFISNIVTKKKIFGQLVSLLDRENALTKEKKKVLEKIYLEDKRKSVTENTFTVLNELSEEEKACIKFKFDWEDWEEFIKEKDKKLLTLYLLLATFYQFGISLDMEFCSDFFRG